MYPGETDFESSRWPGDCVSRRRLLLTSVAATAGGLAGCGGDGGGSGSDGGSGGDGGGAPPGADVLGGPNDLRSRADIRATVLNTDQGAGVNVFTPAVVWVEQGGTVVWEFEEAFHTVTVYHAQYDRPQRIPDGVETPFNSEFSGVGDPGTSFNFVFDVPGVWNYFCKPHEGTGMVGVVVVGGPDGGPGTTSPDDVTSTAAADNLARQLENAGLFG